MRDHVTEELISAYVDGELEGDELRLVEKLLAQSPEHLQLLEEFQSLRASMWSLPSLRLPADFHTRVVSHIDELAVSPAKEPAGRAGRESKARTWGSVFVAMASLAALVTLTVMLRPPAPAPSIPSSPERVRTPFVMPVYFQKVPKYVMVYDVTVTPGGQKEKILDKLLKKQGIGIDPALRLDKKLERELMVIRESKQAKGKTEATPYKNDPAVPKSTDKDKVELIYLVSTVGVLDQFGDALQQMSIVGTEISELHYDFAIEPNKVGVMHRLHDTAREHFAHRTNIVPSEIGHAFRLSFSIELTSVSVPGAATFPVLSIVPESASSGAGASGSRGTAAFDENGDGAITAVDAAAVISRLNELGDEADRDSSNGLEQAGQPIDWTRQPGHILLIIRNADANAAGAK